ncbi:MAG: M48 family metallopeptidase [Prevotellaceae bacterium]|nr:M48 family metallopeptidase [Prevotellaceae bacterium]
MEYVQIGDVSIEVFRKPIKNIHLRVYPPDGSIQISAPEKMKLDSIRLFAITKSEWIKKKQQELKTFSRQSAREYVSGENHYFRGNRYRLRVIYQHTDPHIELQGTQFINLYVRREATIERRAEILKDWYRADLNETLENLIPKWEEILDVTVDHWKIQHMKTLWGSCNVKRRGILFNLELAKKPFHCIEYIVVHELAHLIVQNHGERFTALLDANLPNWRRTKEQLDSFIV